MKNNFFILSLKITFVAFFVACIGGLFGFAVIPVMSSILPLWATLICSVLFYLACFLVIYVILEEYLR